MATRIRYYIEEANVNDSADNSLKPRTWKEWLDEQRKRTASNLNSTAQGIENSLDEQHESIDVSEYNPLKRKYSQESSDFSQSKKLNVSSLTPIDSPCPNTLELRIPKINRLRDDDTEHAENGDIGLSQGANTEASATQSATHSASIDSEFS
jgi:hypothetical protein